MTQTEVDDGMRHLTKAKAAKEALRQAESDA